VCEHSTASVCNLLAAKSQRGSAHAAGNSKAEAGTGDILLGSVFCICIALTVICGLVASWELLKFEDREQRRQDFQASLEPYVSAVLLFKFAKLCKFSATFDNLYSPVSVGTCNNEILTK